MGERVHELVGGHCALVERVDAVGQPKSRVAVGGVGVHLNGDVVETYPIHRWVDFDIGEVALANGSHGQVLVIYAHSDTRENQVGVELIREPLSFKLLVKLLYFNGIEGALGDRSGFHVLDGPLVVVDGHYTC